MNDNYIKRIMYALIVYCRKNALKCKNYEKKKYFNGFHENKEKN